jgi:hypothetical protein
MVLALFILFGSSTTRVFRIVVCTFGTLTHLVAQRCANEAACNGANRTQNGTRYSARYTTAYGSYSFTSVNASRVGGVAASSTLPILVVVICHPSHSLVCVREAQLLFQRSPRTYCAPLSWKNS